VRQSLPVGLFLGSLASPEVQKIKCYPPVFREAGSISPVLVNRGPNVLTGFFNKCDCQKPDSRARPRGQLKFRGFSKAIPACGALPWFLRKSRRTKDQMLSPSFTRGGSISPILVNRGPNVLTSLFYKGDCQKPESPARPRGRVKFRGFSKAIPACGAFPWVLSKP
jgi:hypothetical protein